MNKTALSYIASVLSSRWFETVLFVLIIACESVSLLLSANRKLFWYDELLTLHVSNLHPFSFLWKALSEGIDGMPPGYYLIVQLSNMLSGDPHIILRLPSIFGYILVLLGVYLFVRKKLPPFAGLMAVILITLSPFRLYAVEARSYSLMVGFLAISAALWQRIDERRFMVLPFGLFLTLAVSCHYYAVLAVSSFGLAELTRAIMSRRIRWGVWAACLFAIVPFLFYLPILLHYRDIFGTNFWARPDWATLVETYKRYYVFDGLKLTLVLIFFFGIVSGYSMLRALSQSGERAFGDHFGFHEVVLVGAFLLYPALLVVITKLSGGGYVERYGLPVILGLAIGTVYLFFLNCPKIFAIHLLGALLIVFTMQSGADFVRFTKGGADRLDERWKKLAEIGRAETSIPVVIGNLTSYLEAVQYAPPELRDRLVYVDDPNMACRMIGTDSGYKIMTILARFVPLRFEKMFSFETEHRKFILYSGPDWVTRYFVEEKYDLTLLAKGVNGLEEKTFDSIFMVERPM